MLRILLRRSLTLYDPAYFGPFKTRGERGEEADLTKFFLELLEGVTFQKWAGNYVLGKIFDLGPTLGISVPEI